MRLGAFRRPGQRGTIPFHWNGRRHWGRPGDSIAAALWRGGVRVIGVSRKRHRPMGVSGAYLQGALVKVDGEPHVRADLRQIAADMRVVRQNAWPHPRFDLLTMLRAVPDAWARGGFEQTMLFPGGSRRFAVWERFLGVLAGEVELDARPSQPVADLMGRRFECDVVVIGGGPAGVAAANRADDAGNSVVLVSRGQGLGDTAAAFHEGLEHLRSGVTALLQHEAAGLYDHGRLVLAAPLHGGEPAVVIKTERLVLAHGVRSCPPLVPGHDLPGVLDLAAAIRLARELGPALGRTIVIGTGREAAAGAALARLGVPIVTTLAVAGVRRMIGVREVRGITLADGARIACHTVVHAGPWRTDPGLSFQARATGTFRLAADAALPANVSIAGAAAQPDEAVVFTESVGIRNVALCPCMDVTIGEVFDVARTDCAHVEIVKRRTSCGMGPCQGFPCWELLSAVIRTVDPAAADDRPSHRAPRRGVTVAQAAGLYGLLDLDV